MRNEQLPDENRSLNYESLRRIQFFGPEGGMLDGYMPSMRSFPTFAACLPAVRIGRVA